MAIRTGGRVGSADIPSQAPKEGDVTSNTQWSIVYDDTHLTAEIAIRRDWDSVIKYDLAKNALD